MVNGTHCYCTDLPQGGLEIPCLLKFIAEGENEAPKTKGLLEFALSTTSVESIVVSVTRAQAGAGRCEAEVSSGEADSHKTEVSARGVHAGTGNQSTEQLQLSHADVKMMLQCQRPVELKRYPPV